MEVEEFIKFALSLPETVEEPHFERTAFKIRKKIFATLDSEKANVTVRLSKENQDIFSLIDKTNIYPVPNKWGKQGWTIFNFPNLKSEIVFEVLKIAYCSVASKKLQDLIELK